MNRKKIMALLLTTFLSGNMTANFVYADINDTSYRSQYVQMFQSEPVAENAIPKSEITAAATSSQSGEDASKTIDGDINTLWHTPWAGVDLANNPQSLTLNLGKIRNVSSIHVTPRQNGTNGIIKDYKIYAGDTVIAEGTWKTDTSTKYIILPEPVSTDDIRIEAISSIGDSADKYVSIAEVDVYEANEIPAKLTSESNLIINAGQGGDLTSQLDSVKSLEEGTAIIRFTTSGTGIQSLFSISNNTKANEHFHVYINGGQVGYELRKQSGNISTGVVSKSLNEGINTIAFRAEKSGGYSIYLNGEEILNNNLETADFLMSLEDVNTFKLGTTDRLSGNEYNFTGKIDFFEIYDKPLADRYIKEITGQTKAADLPLPEGTVKTDAANLFESGDLGSPNFRIPALYTTQEGTVLATIDVRNNGGHDAPGNNIDIGLKRSTDGGVTWDEGKVILDYPGKSAAIDTSMVQDKETGRIFLIVTHFAEGYGFPNAVTGSGYKEIDNVRYLRLFAEDGSEYTVRDNGVVFDSNNVVTGYTVDEDQNLFLDGAQVGNILLSSSPLKVMGTSFLSMIYSDDDGISWSKPIDLTKQAKAEWMRFFGTGPGKGIQVENGEYAGRLVFPIYLTNSSGFQSSAVIYSDDHGQTWNTGETATDGRIMSNGQAASAETITGDSAVGQLTEAQVVEMPNGQLKMFMRNTGGNSGRVRIATSFDGGETWEDDVVRDENLPEPYCQLSVINYSEKIDGKDALIFSNPNASSRSNGTVRVGLISEDGTYENGEPKYDIEWKYSKAVAPGTFGYSCLSEMPNGEVGLFYEATGSTEMAFTRMNIDYLKADLLADAPSAKIESITILDADSNYEPGDTANLKITFDQTVSLFGDRNLTLSIDGKEVTGEVTKISGTDYKITVRLPQDIDAGEHKISIKPKTGLEIVNIVGKVMDISEEIITESVLTTVPEEIMINKVFEYSNFRIENGSSNGNISLEADNVKELEEGTIIMRFDNNGGNTFQTLLSFSNNIEDRERIYLYLNKNNEIGVERQSADGNILHKASALTLNEGINTVAFRVEKNTGYSIFLNGEKVSDEIISNTKFIKGISDINSINIGISARATMGGNPFTGDVDFVSLYGNRMTDDELIEITSETSGNAEEVTPEIEGVTIKENESAFAVGDEIIVDIKMNQAVSMIGEKTIVLLAGGAEIPVTFESQIDGKNYVFTGIIPEGISGGTHDISIKSSVELDIINVNGEKVDLSQDIPTSTTLTIADEEVVKVDKSILQALVTECSGMNEGDYTVESWEIFSDVLGNAKLLLEENEVSQEMVDFTVEQLQTAKDGLLEKKEDIEIFKTHLEIAVETAEGITDFTDVIPAVRFEFKEALEEAIKVLSDDGATQELVNQSFDRLSKAIHMLEFKGNKDALINLINQIKGLDGSRYTKDSWDVLQAVINSEDVQEVINDENALQADIEKSYNDVFSAFSKLVEESKKVNKDKLNELIAKAENLNDSKYITTTWNNLIGAVSSAKIVSENTEASQEEVDEAYINLLRAYLGLRLKPNKDILKDLINRADGIDSSRYTDESYKAVEKEFNSAKAVLEDENASEEDILKAERGLEGAIARLVLREEGSAAGEEASEEKEESGSLDNNSNNNSNNSSENSNTGNQNNSTGKGNSKLPATGGRSAAAVGLIGTISAMLGAVMFKKKEKPNN